jgi:hypothetical protein
MAWADTDRVRATVLWRSHLMLLAVRNAGRAGADATGGLSILGVALRRLTLAGVDAFEDTLRVAAEDWSYARMTSRPEPTWGRPPSVAVVEAFVEALADACEFAVSVASQERSTAFADALEYVPAAMLRGDLSAPLFTDPREPEEVRLFAASYRQRSEPGS